MLLQEIETFCSHSPFQCQNFQLVMGFMITPLEMGVFR